MEIQLWKLAVGWEAVLLWMHFHRNTSTVLSPSADTVLSLWGYCVNKLILFYWCIFPKAFSQLLTAVSCVGLTVRISASWHIAFVLKYNLTDQHGRGHFILIHLEALKQNQERPPCTGLARTRRSELRVYVSAEENACHLYLKLVEGWSRFCPTPPLAMTLTQENSYRPSPDHNAQKKLDWQRGSTHLVFWITLSMWSDVSLIFTALVELW